MKHSKCLPTASTAANNSHVVKLTLALLLHKSRQPYQEGTLYENLTRPLEKLELALTADCAIRRCVIVVSLS